MNKRLNALAEMVDNDSRVADIGTDHAYLPITLIRNKKIVYAIASDIAAGPLKNAEKDIEKAGLSKQIDLRLGTGLTTVKSTDRIDTVVIAGMGGKLIRQILEDNKQRSLNFKTLILEPNIGEINVRYWLMENNYEIVAEKLIFEAGHTYELIKAKMRDHKINLSNKELFFGPLILKEKNIVFYKKWQSQLIYYKKLLVNLNKATNKDEKRIAIITESIRFIEDEL